MRRLHVVWLIVGILGLLIGSAIAVDLLDETKPADSDLVSTYGSNARETRTTVNALISALSQVGANWYNLTEFDNMTEALSTIGSSRAMLLVNDNASIDTSTSVPSTLALVVIDGVKITVASTKTLTINGPFYAGSYQVFAGAGSVKFGNGSADSVNPRWWVTSGTGTDTDPWMSTCDNASGIKAALDSGTHYVKATPGWYYMTAIPTLLHGQTLEGDGGNATRIISTNTTTGISVGDSTKVENVKYAKLLNLNIICQGAATKCVRVSAATDLQLKGLRIDLEADNQTGIYLDAACAVSGSCIAQGYHSGVYYSAFQDIIISGINSTNANTGIETHGASGYSGNTGANYFAGIKLQYLKYGFMVETALNNYIASISCEGFTDSVDSRCVKWGTSVYDNRIDVLYTEMPTSNWTGTVAESVTKGVRNKIYTWRSGGGTNPNPRWPDRIKLYGTNTIEKGGTVYGSYPGEDDENGTTLTSTTIQPYQIQVPGELGPRVTIASDGIGVQASGNDDGDNKTATSAAYADGTVTITLAGHGVTSGDYVHVDSCDESGYNGTYYATKDGDTFTYPILTAPAATATGCKFHRIQTPNMPRQVSAGGVANIRQKVLGTDTTIDLSLGHHIYMGSNTYAGSWEDNATADGGNATFTYIKNYDLYSSQIILFEAYPADNTMSIKFDGNNAAPSGYTQVIRFSAAAQNDANVLVDIPDTYDVEVHFKNNDGAYYWYMTCKGTSTYRTCNFTTPVYGPVP